MCDLFQLYVDAPFSPTYLYKPRWGGGGGGGEGGLFKRLHETVKIVVGDMTRQIHQDNNIKARLHE